MKKILITSTLFLAMAQANVSISSSSYQQETKVAQDGKKIMRWIKASKVVPGTVVRYVNALENSGAKKANKLVIKNPIPENMEYIGNTALCKTGCTLSYSIDGGKSYKKSDALYVGVGKDRHVAKASEYTDIKWVLNELNGHSQSSVEYKARLK